MKNKIQYNSFEHVWNSWFKLSLFFFEFGTKCRNFLFIICGFSLIKNANTHKYSFTKKKKNTMT